MSSEPLLISAGRVRELLGVTVAQLRRLRQRHVVPGPVPGTRLYNLAAVKKALDTVQDSCAGSDEDDLIRRAKAWGASA